MQVGLRAKSRRNLPSRPGFRGLGFPGSVVTSCSLILFLLALQLQGERSVAPMEESLHYSSRSESKRKFDDQGTPTSPAAPVSGRRPTGFSAPITSPHSDTAAPASYNNAPPPPDGIQLAKQRAQEIAARLFSDAEAKRPRVENGDGADDSNSKGFRFDQSTKTIGQTALPVGMPTPMSFASYGYPGSSKKINIPNGRVGVIIGKSGETIKYLQVQSGAKIQVTRDMDADPNSQTRCVEIVGTPEQISNAEQLINDVLEEADAGGSGMGSRKFTNTPTGVEHFSMKVQNNKVGLIIGKGGESIRNMQATSGARIQVIPLHLPPGDPSTERTVHIDGTKEQIETAKQLVNDVISENRARNPLTAGGYRPPRPPTSWVTPGAAPPTQQPAYGYMQPGAYPVPQYNMSQQSYGGYPAPAASGWDQTSNPASQQTAQGTGYDYYSQQQAQQQQPISGSSAPTDSNSYNYNQMPPIYNTHGTYGDSTYSQSAVGQQQGYGQAGSYTQQEAQAGYAQPISTSQTGYAQQVYGSGSAYSNTSGSAQEGSAPNYTAQGANQQAPQPGQPSTTQQGYATQQPGTAAQPGYGMLPPQPGYGNQSAGQTGYSQSAPSAQPGYGQSPQGQNLAPAQAVYGQSQQPPTSQAGFTQPTQGYSQPAQGYSQTAPASSVYAPPSGYASGIPQVGYGQQSQGGASQNQTTGYVQQQQQAYNDPYGGGVHSQPSYSSDGTHGSYDAPSTAQAALSGVTKASPKSC